MAHKYPMLVLLLFALLFPNGVNAQCNLCKKEGPEGTIAFPDKEISVPGYPFLNTCGSLNLVLPLLTPDSDECGLLQSLGTLCGCPIEEDACILCPHANMTNPDGDLPFLSFLFGGIVPTCELYEAFLHNFEESTSDCIVGKAFLSGYCGCPAIQDDDTPASTNNNNDTIIIDTCSTCPGGGPIGDPDANISIPGLPFGTCGQLDGAVTHIMQEGTPQCDLVQSISSVCGCEIHPEPCTLCWDGSPIPHPEKAIEWAKDAFLGVTPTCSLYEAYVGGLSAHDSTCRLTQGSGGSHCGCPPQVENHCVFCEGGFPKQNLQDDMPFVDLDPSLGIASTCELFQTFETSLTPGDGFCLIGQYVSYMCGCNNGVVKYYGADTDFKKGLLVWLLRFSGLLSVLGAAAIQRDVLTDKRRRTKLYNQLVFTLSIFDDMTAIALIFGPIPVPTEQDFYGAAGNELTCEIQSFFVAFGFVSVFYNISLAVYYKLTIVDSWKEDRLKKWRFAFHGIPVTLGLVLASLSVHYGNQTPLFCHVNPFPLVDEWRIILWLAWVPIASGIILIAVLMLYVYYHVQKQQKTAMKWSFEQKVAKHGNDGAGVKSSVHVRLANMFKRQDEGAVARAKNRLVQQVFWQAVAYLMSFCITWPILLAAEAYGGLVVGGGNYGFWIVVAIVSPLQGFNNFLVYFRPRWERARQQRLKERKAANAQTRPESLFAKLWHQLVCRKAPKKDEDKRETNMTELGAPETSTSDHVAAAALEPPVDVGQDKKADVNAFEDDEGSVVDTLENIDNSLFADSDGAQNAEDSSFQQSFLYEPAAALASDDLLERMIQEELDNEEANVETEVRHIGSGDEGSEFLGVPLPQQSVKRGPSMLGALQSLSSRLSIAP